MKYVDLISHYGSEAEAARARGIDRQRVHSWKSRERIPTDDQIEYEVLSNGALRADLPEAIRESVLSVERES